MPIASIIITTKNEEANIANCLQSIKTQTYPQDKIEIIVVDNNSQDKTKEIALTFTDKVYNHGHERSAQRNFGMINIAKGKYVMFVDGDMVLSEELIEEAVNSMESNSNLVGLYVPLRWVGDNWIIKGKGFEREFYDASCLDAVRFIKREIIVKIGGFDERLYAAEDWDLDKRIRQEGKVTSIRSIMYHYEDKAVNLKEHLQKNQYYLKNIMIYIQKYGEDDPDIKRQFSLWYRYFLVFAEHGKWKKLVMHPIAASRMYFLKIIVGIQYLLRRLKK